MGKIVTSVTFIMAWLLVPGRAGLTTQEPVDLLRISPPQQSVKIALRFMQYIKQHLADLEAKMSC